MKNDKEFMIPYFKVGFLFNSKEVLRRTKDLIAKNAGKDPKLKNFDAIVVEKCDDVATFKKNYEETLNEFLQLMKDYYNST